MHTTAIPIAIQKAVGSPQRSREGSAEAGWGDDWFPVFLRLHFRQAQVPVPRAIPASLRKNQGVQRPTAVSHRKSRHEDRPVPTPKPSTILSSCPPSEGGVFLSRMLMIEYPSRNGGRNDKTSGRLLRIMAPHSCTTRDRGRVR